METEEVESKEHVVVPIVATQRTIREVEDGVLHDGEKYLYKPDEEFQSCCFKCDKPLCLHISKMFVSVSVLFFLYVHASGQSKQRRILHGDHRRPARPLFEQ